MKPRYERVSKDVMKMLDRAEKLVERADAIEKASMADKDKYCMKNFGKKYSECSDKQKAQCDKAHGKVEKAKMCSCGSGKPKASCCPDVKKGVHHNATIESTETGGAEFHIVQGESSRNMFYYTNNSLLESTDVANKGASSSSMDLDGLHKKLNPHDVNIKIDTAGGRDLSGQSRE